MNKKNWLVLISFPLALSFDPAFGASIKVLKSKGQNAVVEFPEGVKPKMGASFQLAEVDSEAKGEEEVGAPSGGPARDYSIALSGPLFSKQIGGDASESLSAAVGFNMKMFEIAPYVSFSHAAATVIGFGLGADVNFAKNEPGVAMVPALGLNLGMLTGSGTAFSFGGSLGLKMFVLRQSSSAIRPAFVFSLSKASGVAGFGKVMSLSLAISTYF